eukprot:TRINITY_DN11765_c0_g3_i1.p1 TRINITY_DN11765_c0_g3~~TRINITY_DN11765_c0_g3_i1.p1  ORF type:complete len:377 (+),score=4.67 TRINITY_DN11765_c0_g3_i1:91-1221(+)
MHATEHQHASRSPMLVYLLTLLLLIQIPTIILLMNMSNEAAIASWRHGRVDQTPPLAPRTSCIRYIQTYATQHAGLGHRIMGVILALNIAVTMQAALVIDDSVWSSGGLHGSYQAMRAVCNMDRFLSTSNVSNAISFRTVLSFNDAVSHMRGCNVAVAVPSDSHFCQLPDGKMGYCSGVKGLMYARAQEHLGPETCTCQQRARSTSSESNVYEMSVVWHFRQGDITINLPPDALEQVTRDLTAAAQRATETVMLKHTIISETTVSIPGLPSNAQYLTVEIADAFREMQKADILIATGSSLPLAAAVTRCMQAPAILFPPKEGADSLPFYRLHSSITTNGSMTSLQVIELAALISHWIDQTRKCNPLKVDGRGLSFS